MYDAKAKARARRYYEHHKEEHHQYYLSHKKEIIEKARRYLQEHPDKHAEKLAYYRRFYRAHKDRHREYRKRRLEKHRAEINAYNREYMRRNRGRYRERHLIKNQELKRKVLSHYSPSLTCQKCGFDDIRALSIDHIKGGGTKHRKIISNLYRWLVKNNFPEGFQVLCMNCQWIKRYEREIVHL